MSNNEKQKLIKIWKKFAGNNEKIILNPDQKWVAKITDGVIENQKKYGLKYCPCRIISGRKEEDEKLLCPCNFFIQDTWKNKGECWCGLFKKLKK